MDAALALLRRWATPLTIGAFLLVAATGVLMFFDLQSGLNRGVHEWLSWALVAGVASHVFVHVKSFQRHLRSTAGRVFVGVFATALVLSFSSWGVRDSDKVIEAVSHHLVDTPIATLAVVAHSSPSAVKERLRTVGVRADDAQTIRQLAGDQQNRQVELLEAIFGG